MFPGGLSLAPMDFDGDGDLDFVGGGVQGGYSNTQLLQNSRLIAMRNDGLGNFVEATAEVFVGSNVVMAPLLVPAEINGDGLEDLYVADFGADSSGSGGQDLIFIRTADGRLVNETETRLPMIGSGAARVGDFDGDGDIDIIREGNYFGNEPLFLINNGTGHFAISSDRLPPDVGFSALACAVLDVEKDGDLDLFFGTGDDAHPHVILLNDGAGYFTKAPAAGVPPVLFGADGVSKNAVTADFDADGWPDIAATVLRISNAAPGIQLLLNNGDGTFRDLRPARSRGARDRLAARKRRFQ